MSSLTARIIDGLDLIIIERALSRSDRNLTMLGATVEFKRRLVNRHGHVRRVSHLVVEGSVVRLLCITG